ncbi:MAG TPA: NYN domain-containing protein [Pseudonocardia sp.]|jgi:predicted RNA-binding protein with PIN domain|nr:NYN domain-containing protein [Pseudonocardia sp.]
MAEQAWIELPEPVRVRLAEVASVAVAELPAAEVPASLRRLTKFTPSKRARLGAKALLGELQDSAAFRAAVLAWWEEHRPGELTGPDADPVGGVAGAVLAEAPDLDERLGAVAERAEVVTLRAQLDAALARVDKLGGELERLRAELAESRSGARELDQERDGELDRLRRRYREQGSRLREAEDGTRAAERELAELRERGATELAAALADRDRARERAAAERVRAARASDEVTGARQAAREARQADEVRLELLMDTLAGAVSGLRRELGLGGGAGPRPADLVGGVRVPGRGGARVSDAHALDRLLSLPSVHLIVDGYNVSKTGYPELTLFDQRNRLVGALGALTARTGAEVTVVFDGAAVVAGPLRHPRGVRVLFSEPGVLADDVIRELVAAEPAGRPLLVATSDRAVADSVRRRGAHPLPSRVLLDLLGRY